MKYIFCFLLLLILAGCSATNQIIVADYDINSENKLPSVTVFLQRPSEDFRQECETFDGKSVLHHCLLNRLNLSKFSEEIQQSGLFNEVLYANTDVDYRLLVTTGSYNLEGGDDLGSAIISGATLMLAPAIISTNIKVDASLYWYEYELKRFQYDLPVQLRASLFSLNQDTERDIAKSVASHILRDIQSEDLFTPSHIAKTLQSSDYKGSLKTPDKAENYLRFDTFIFNHPFQGAMVRYFEDAYPSDHIDVFVYPVRSTSWESDAETLNQEIANTQKDIELSNKENNVETVRVDNSKPISFQRNGQTIDALTFESEHHDTLYNEYISQTYLMIINDKFVKVRHTALKGGPSRKDLGVFVQQIADNIIVPTESLFMAKVRKSWRDEDTTQTN